MRSQMVGIRQKMSAFQSTLTALKRRLLLFLIAAGLPLSFSYTAGSGCTGLCGSCQGTCLPSLAVLFLLGCKVGYAKLKQWVGKRGHHAESSC